MSIGLSLSQFRSKIADVARPNRFEIEIYPTDLYDDFLPEEYEIIPWTVQSAKIPQRSQGEIGIKYHGMELKLPGDYSRENLDIEFLSTYGYEGRNYFERWMNNHIQNTEEINYRRNAYDIINTCNIVLSHLGRTDADVLASYVFYNCFPLTISAIDLNMSNNDQAEKFTVTFAYSHWINGRAVLKSE